MGPLAKTFISHVLRLCLILLAVGLLGWWVGSALLLIVAVLFIYLIWHLTQTKKLIQWLDSNSSASIHSLGLWDKLFARLEAKFQSKTLEIKSLSQRNQSLLEASNAFPDALIFLDADLNLQRFNPLAAKNLGLQDSDIGLPVTNLIRGPEFSHWLESQGMEINSLDIKSPINENQILRVKYVSYTSTQVMLVFSDITLASMQDKIRHDFVANVSHELRTPLTVLAGYLEMLSADEKDPQHEIFVKLRQQSTAMTELVSDLLELARLQDESGQPELINKRVNVPHILDQLGQTAVDLSGERHSIHTQIDQQLQINGIKRDLESAFGNLIANAVRYTQPGGEIQIRWFAQNHSAIFEVIDNGPGISSQDLPRLTERFYRSDSGRNRHHGGTGLGLAIVKHIAEKHHAQLEIESEVNSGSTFRVIFPL